jgi:hypothetical protein
MIFSMVTSPNRYGFIAHSVLVQLIRMQWDIDSIV